jgi:hypothetical protein
VTIVSRDEDYSWEVGSVGMGCIFATTRNGRRSARTPTGYFKRLLEEACPNHAYPVKHKLKDSSMMQTFMTSGSLTWVPSSTKDPMGATQHRSSKRMTS